MRVVCVCRFGRSFTYVIKKVDSKLISVYLINDYSLIVYGRAECASISLLILNNFGVGISWSEEVERWESWKVEASSYGTAREQITYTWYYIIITIKWVVHKKRLVKRSFIQKYIKCRYISFFSWYEYLILSKLKLQLGDHKSRLNISLQAFLHKYPMCFFLKV